MPRQLILFITLLIAPLPNAAQRPPAPGYYPSSRFRSMSFYQGYRNLWGPAHQTLDNNGITIWLDRNSGFSFFNFVLPSTIHNPQCSCFLAGSGFKSVKPFRSGYFGASIKLQPGYTAGVITAFYVRSFL